MQVIFLKNENFCILMKIINPMLPTGSDMDKNSSQSLLGQIQPKNSPKIAQKRQFQSHFCPFWSNVRRGRSRWQSTKFLNLFGQNRLIRVSKSMLKHRTHPTQYQSYHLKVDFCIHNLVKFQILINFPKEMKCWIFALDVVIKSADLGGRAQSF